MENIILSIVLILILGFAIGYIVKAKKNGVKCIGCPSGCNCSSQNGKCCCGETEE